MDNLRNLLGIKTLYKISDMEWIEEFFQLMTVSFGGLVLLKSNRAAKERMYRKSFGEVIMKDVDGMSE